MNPTQLKRIVTPLLAWYTENARDLPFRRTTDPYAIWVSEVMLQQTRVGAILEKHQRFLTHLPTIEALATVSDDDLLKLWEGLGYYRRAANLKRAAQLIMAEHGGVFPKTYEKIRALPGIGDYTAAAVGSICFALPYPAVDGNVLRVLSRLFQWDSCIDTPAAKREADQALRPVFIHMQKAGQSEQSVGTLNQALMELGATVCLPRGAPLCDVCPLAHMCKARKAGVQLSYPIRAKKAARKIEHLTIFILTWEDKLAVCKREKSGLLANLWQLPNVQGTLDEPAALDTLRTFGVEPIELLRRRELQHIFTHIHWQMRGYYIRCKTPCPSFTWVTESEREVGIALPTAFGQFLG